jgi:hypothetical protein
MAEKEHTVFGGEDDQPQGIDGDLSDEQQLDEDESDEEEEAKPLSQPADLSIVPLGRDAMLSTKKDAKKIHQVPAFGGVVFFKEFTPSARDAFEASLVVGKGKKAKVSTKNIRAKMLAALVVDQKGRRIFKDIDVGEIGELPGPEVEKVYQAIQEVNKLSDEDIEELAGNSGADRSDSGPQS